MPQSLTLRGEVDAEGRVSKALGDRVRDVLKLYRDGVVEITIAPPRRSTKANAYYWVAVVPAVQRAMEDGNG